ncbi:MAG: AraC family transcriptional regulator [Clostridia bacterium]|nr:AraC family transcriptional regulator [Clostridia bacterium]
MDKTLFEKHTNSASIELGMYYCGKRVATKNHVYGPQIRLHFLLVLVEKGSAVLYRNGQEIAFGERDLFVMFPGERIYYRALTDWSIHWIGVDGPCLETFFETLAVTREHPVYHPAAYEELLSAMHALYELPQDDAMRTVFCCQSLLCSFFSALAEGAVSKKEADPVATALSRMQYHYADEWNINRLAGDLFLDAAYFSRLFRRRIGCSPKQYILRLRMEKAKELLRTTNFSIQEIAAAVGFSDPLYFSRVFRAYEGKAPALYRKEE